MLGREFDSTYLCERLNMMGIETEVIGDELKLEILHNRPDLLSPEGVVRALKGFLGIETGLPKYRATPSGITLRVDKSVKSVRPFISAGVVTGVKLTDEIVASLMQVQEKLHASLCRNRRKGSIGVYDLDTIEPPIRYTTVSPEEISFTPLDFGRTLTPAQILREHPKGIEYGWIMEGWNRYPILMDEKGRVLSMPPIINSEETRVTEKTERLFIDVTGEDERLVNWTLVILMTSLSERGFRLHTVSVEYPNKRIETPSLRPKRYSLNVKVTNELLGLNLKPSKIAEILKTMRYGVAGSRKDSLTLLAPPYRGDILHQVDLIEDVGIGYGYDKLTPVAGKVFTIGKKAPIESLADRVREIMIGLGFTEVMTYTLTNPHVNFELMRTTGDAVEISNPVSEDYTIVRTWLLPSLLSVLRSNKRNPLPQQIFEVGDVVLLDDRTETGAVNVRRVAAVAIGSRANWTYIKAVADALLRELDIAAEVRGTDHPSFLGGRVAEFIFRGRRLGVAGEVHPEVILGFELEHPVVALEFDLISG